MKHWILTILLFSVCLGINAQQVKLLWANGAIKEKGQMQNGFKDGKWEEFYETGKTRIKGKYKKGKYGLYDADINGFYEDGKKWFHIIYNSENRTEIAEEFSRDGQLFRTTNVLFNKLTSEFKLVSKQNGISDSSVIDTRLGKVKWFSNINSDLLIEYNFSSAIKAIKKNKSIEVIKNILYDIPANNSTAFIKQLNNFYDGGNWNGNVVLRNEKDKIISDSTVIDNQYRYYFEHTYLNDTLAYSKTIMDNHPYYIFTPSFEGYIVLKILGSKNKQLLELYSDYITLPKNFPDGTWLFLYSKDKKQYLQARYEFLRRKVNDTTLYQNSPYNMVYYMQEFKNQKPDGVFKTFYFYSDSSEYLNSKIPTKAAKYQPLQFNTPLQLGYYKNGKKDGTFYKFLLDGKSEKSCSTFSNGLSQGVMIYNYTDETGMLKLDQLFINYFEIYLNPTDNALRKVNINNPRQGYYNRYGYSIDPYLDKYGKKGYYVVLEEYYGIPQPIGLYLKIEDTITNLQNVISKNKLKCKYYSEVYHDENGTVAKYITYRYGKIKQFGIMEPSPVWTQSPKKIKLEEYDDNGIIISRTTFNYNKKESYTATYKNGKLVKKVKDALWVED